MTSSDLRARDRVQRRVIDLAVGRRAVIAATASMALAWLDAARAQAPARRPTIGFLAPTPVPVTEWLTAFLRRLHELGWVEGHSVAIEYRWVEGGGERLAEIAAELVRLKVDVIVTAGTPAVLAVKNATATIPIVFASAGDPVGTGLVANLARPGGNATGFSIMSADLAGKRLELLRELIPDLRRLAVLVNAGFPDAMRELGEVQAVARVLGLDVLLLEIRRAEDLGPAIAQAGGHADALYVCGDPLVFSNHQRISTAALGTRLPTIHSLREHVVAGGLMSYGTNFPDLFRRSAEHVDKILRGAKPADLPVEQPTKFDFVINMITARALGLTVSPTLLTRADEVIE